MQKVINFSGGQSSALMTILEYQPGDIVLFTDTGREHAKTYKFLNDFEAFENIPVTRTAYPGGYSEMIKKRGYGYVPNRVARYCTKHLKVTQAKRFLTAMGVKKCINCIGFRSDEQRRIKNYTAWYRGYVPSFPLNERKIDKQQVNEYWKHKPYKLEIPRILGNCDLCFLKGKAAITSILISHPELAAPWIADEEREGGTFINGISYRQMLNIANNTLFKNYDLNEIDPAFNCACTT